MDPRKACKHLSIEDNLDIEHTNGKKMLKKEYLRRL
jgi:hypothetical protein